MDFTTEREIVPNGKDVQHVIVLTSEESVFRRRKEYFEELMNAEMIERGGQLVSRV